jgi:hypothetical protein
MLLLISDANILIDMEAGELMETLFQLPMQFAIPDVLYWEEIQPGRPDLEKLGLRVLEVNGEYVAYAFGLSGKYGPVPSRNDYLALALAKQEACPLLSGDHALRWAAEQEEVPVMGSIWLLEDMVKSQFLNVDQALSALNLMRKRKRRLPWSIAEHVLKSMRRN